MSSSSVLVVGAGGLASTILPYLAGAGIGMLSLSMPGYLCAIATLSTLSLTMMMFEISVCIQFFVNYHNNHTGRLGVVDFDVVELSNLHRQVFEY